MKTRGLLKKDLNEAKRLCEHWSKVKEIEMLAKLESKDERLFTVKDIGDAVKVGINNMHKMLSGSLIAKEDVGNSMYKKLHDS